MRGCVYLVGAGCGRADLITLRGLRLLQCCDVVVYDDLIDRHLLEAAPQAAERLYVGKRLGRHSTPQEEISRLLVKKALEGKVVIRLKGGDPFVFGRGGEEMEALLSAGIPCEEVPGITSAVAIPAAVGIPVTHRGVSRSFHVITGHTFDERGEPAGGWGTLANLEGTLVFLMGLANLEGIADGLLSAGKRAETPAAVISSGMGPRPVAVRAPLAQLAEKTRAAELKAPAIILVGPTAALDFSATVEHPLSGVRVGVTGTAGLRQKLQELLTGLGAVVETAAGLTVEELPLPLRLEDLCAGRSPWLVFTSANGVDIFFRKARRAGSAAPGRLPLRGDRRVHRTASGQPRHPGEPVPGDLYQCGSGGGSEGAAGARGSGGAAPLPAGDGGAAPAAGPVGIRGSGAVPVFFAGRAHLG